MDVSTLEPATDGNAEQRLTVLVVEDTQEDYELAANALKSLPCDVEITWARDYESAYEHVISNYFTLIILDLVLDQRYETDPERWEGLWLLSDILDFNMMGSRSVIIYTNFPDPQVERNALTRYGVADFLKKSGSKELEAELLDIFDRNHFFGLQCDVVFGEGMSWAQMVQVCTRRESQALTARMSKDLARLELEGLFRRRFADCKAITICRMSEGYSGSGLARVERQFPDGSKGSDEVVKFGDVELIQRELEGWRALKDYLYAPRATEVLDHTQGIGLGILSYRFLGMGADSPRTFGEFFAEASADAIGKSIESVFRDVCRLWYIEENRTPAEELALDSVYRQALGIDIERVEKGYEFRFGIGVRESDVVSYPELDRDLPHLVHSLKHEALAVSTDTWCCRTHGDLHVDNLLVAGNEGACWLIDFGWSGRGHWARDLAVLETSIRFKLLANSDLSSLYEFEDMLANTPTLGAKVDLSLIRDAGTRKVAAIIQRLRETAAEIIEPYPTDRALAEYFVALTFASAKYLEFHRLLDTRWRKRHVMIAAGVLIERLEQELIPAGLLRMRSGAL